jgi:exosortase/archaeosortase family protein
MNNPATALSHTTLPSSWGALSSRGQLAVRIVWAIAALLICYSFDWHWLRLVTSECNLWLDAVAGLHFQRLASDVVSWRGEVFRYTNACCFADVWCAALPLLWNTRHRIARNLWLIAAFTPALFVFNVVRLSISDVLYAHGMPWSWAHSVLGGVAYVAVWMFIRSQSNMLEAQRS